jgi:formylglycine-generating enzyme required for sulfatase activity
MNKTWLWVLLAVPVLVALALTAGQWLPPLLTFAGAESETLAGLVSLVQLVLWIGVAVIAFLGYLRRQRGTRIEALPGVDKKTTRAYLSFLQERYQYLDFKGMGVSDRVPLKLPLLQMYVPLKARVEMPEGETWARDLRLAGRALTPEEAEEVGERLSGPQPLLELLAKHDGLVILGDPGAGKTTFLKYLALTLAVGQGEELGLGTRLPFLVPLSAYATAIAEEDVPLDRFIADYAEKRGMGEPVRPMLEKALAEGGALILLDGLDEVREVGRRNLVVERVRDFYARERVRGTHKGPGNKFVLTSRVVGYREVRLTAEGLGECTLVDFDREEIEAFVGKWTDAIEKAASGEGRLAEQDAKREREDLLLAIRNHPGVEALAANPLLLTILALMKRQGVDLPERRVELYQKYVETLLKHWNLARSLDGRTGPGLDVLHTLRILAPLALWMHEKAPGVGLVKEHELRAELEEIFRRRKEADPEEAARKFVADVREHAGLLLDRGGRQFGFIHLTFQEYLAGLALANRAQEDVEPLVGALAEHVGEAEWREVSLLAVGCLGVIQQRDEAASTVVEALIDRAPGEPGEAVVVAGEAVADIGAVGVTPETRQRVVGELLTTMRAWEEIVPKRRAAAGDLLARLGDPRFSEKYWYLPDDPSLGFVEVPAGKFWMGSDKDQASDAYDDEQPRHELELPGFFIGRFPVTVAQFRAFVEASGQEPGDPDSLQGRANHPVVWVSWHEARAYCEWLGERLRELARERVEKVDGEAQTRFWRGVAEGGLKAGLPSEAEWENAARGDDGRIFPWGDVADPNRASYRETELGNQSSVGCFPGGASPHGCEEMSGNVWEWTRSLWGEKVQEPDFGYPYDPGDGREDLEAGDEILRVLRGGSFFSSQWGVRCAARDWGRPDNRGWHIGFRVVLSPFL